MSDVPVNYDAAEAGGFIGQTANWMKTQARAGKIPFTRVGRQMRWTPQQLAEILRAGEQRPKPALVAAASPRRGVPAGDVPLLQARKPRRKRPAA